MMKNLAIVLLSLLLVGSLVLWVMTGGIERFSFWTQNASTTEYEVEEEVIVEEVVSERSERRVLQSLVTSAERVVEPIIPVEFAWTTANDQIVLVSGAQVQLFQIGANTVETLRNTLLNDGFSVSLNNAADGPGASLSGYEKGMTVCRIFEVFSSQGEEMMTDMNISCGNVSENAENTLQNFFAQVKFATAVEFGLVEEVDFVWYEGLEEERTGKYVTGYRMISPALTSGATPNFAQMFTDWGWQADEANTILGETAGMIAFTKDTMVCQIHGVLVHPGTIGDGSDVQTMYTVYCGNDTSRPVARRVPQAEEVDVQEVTE